MKALLFITLLFFVFGIFSCSSEYQQQMSEAKILQERLIHTQHNLKALGTYAKEEISELNEMIRFHAKLSGNEELFIKELKEVSN